MMRSLWLTAALTAGAIGIFALWAHWPHDPLPEDTEVDRVLVEKSVRRLTIMDRAGEPIRSYPINLGWNPIGHKQQEGDGRTPEGHYVLDWRNPNSRAYLALHISYPNAEDEARAAAHRVSPGGMIMVHGIENGYGWMGRAHRFFGWTAGCIAISNPEMKEIYRVVKNGTPIEIRP